MDSGKTVRVIKITSVPGRCVKGATQQEVMHQQLNPIMKTPTQPSDVQDS